MKHFIILTTLLISSVAFAKEVQAKYFDTYGKVKTVEYKPVNSPLSFKYDVQYYIPAKLKGKTDLKVLVFLHGGGASTVTRAGSLRVTSMYMSDLKTIADALGIVLVTPSGSGNNWGGHMISLLKDLNQTIRTELPVNPNKIALSGHSMGGMGITRTAQWLADEYAFFMPTAAGMEERHQTERNLRPYLNMKYYHMQGLQDHFKVFITRCENQQKSIDAIEKKYNKKTGFELEFYNGSHNYPKATFQKRLETMFNNESRNLYQAELHGMFYNHEEIVSKQGQNSVYFSKRNKYFWLKGLKFTAAKDLVLIDAKVEGNQIDIEVESPLKKLRVYLSNKMVNIKNTVMIKINGKVRFNKVPSLGIDTSNEIKKDPGYKFDTYVDFDL